MKKNWTCVDVLSGTDVADDLASEVAETFGVSVEITGRGVRFYLEGDHLGKEEEAQLARLLANAIASFNLPDPIKYTTSPLLDDDWADRWKAHFKPLRVGEHFVICPTWEEVPFGDALRVIRMDPGRAFGTGHHETTRLCLQWLEEWSQARGGPHPGSLLDVGTGSGILAMAAALLGFDPVLGVDNDPEAIEVAVENTALNLLSDRVELRISSVEAVTGRYKVVIANIQALPLIGMAPDMVRRLESAGTLVLSGILVEQKEEVRAAYETLGLKLVAEKTDGEWCLLVFE